MAREDDPQTWHTLTRCLLTVGLEDDARGAGERAVDGYGDQSTFSSSHDTVWLTTGTTDFEWGTVIKFEE